jgi:hypothetical protein
MSDETYDAQRAQRLIEELRALAMRIIELNDAELLAAGPELLKRMGDVRSELFHYEVRSTYDSPESAERRRLVDEARGQQDALDFDDDGDEEPWRHSGS